MVRLNHGNRPDADDIFQDSMVIIFEKLKQQKLDLQCSFKTYFYAVSKKLWMRSLEKQNKVCLNGFEIDNIGCSNTDIPAIGADFDQDKLYHKHFLLLTHRCQKILIMALKRFSSRQIAEVMGFTSEQYARKRKSLCRKRLIKSIQNDPAYKKIQDNE